MTDQKNSTGNTFLKAQSAMEYLMTYGWAILIIGVVLAALFQLGVFNASSSSATACITQPGYICQAPTLTPDGTITFVVGQITGAPIYNVEFLCTGSQTALGGPNPSTYNSITANGLAIVASTTTGNSILNNQVLTISSLPCYNSNGQSMAGSNVGSTMTGYIWINYTSQSVAPSPANPWRTAKAIKVKAVVT